MNNKKISLKTRIRAIYKHPLFKLHLSIMLWFSIGCLAICFLGNTFNLNASEASGIFQGIGTIFSITSGFLYINYDRIQKQKEEAKHKKQYILKQKRSLEISMPELEFSICNLRDTCIIDYETTERHNSILKMLNDKFSSGNIIQIEQLYYQIRNDLQDAGYHEEYISNIDQSLTEFRKATLEHEQLLPKTNTTSPVAFFGNTRQINLHIRQINKHINQAKKYLNYATNQVH